MEDLKTKRKGSTARSFRISKNRGPYYCGIGPDEAFGADIVDAHYEWKFQVGPFVGISASDELWVTCYILKAITAIARVVVSFDPNPTQMTGTKLVPTQTI
ncbi:glutamine synthetase, partial [Olea europaea subsp. europaea]